MSYPFEDNTLPCRKVNEEDPFGTLKSRSTTYWVSVACGVTTAAGAGGLAAGGTRETASFVGVMSKGFLKRKL